MSSSFCDTKDQKYKYTHSIVRIREKVFLCTQSLTSKTDVPTDSALPAVPEVPCCMCDCKSTLQAILREMRTMRRLMMAQKGQWINE